VSIVYDTAYGRPGGAAYRAAGALGVARYAAAGRADINLTAAEVADYQTHGLGIVVLVEHEAGFMLGGRARGASAAGGSLGVTRAAGLPDGPMFGCVDVDATLGGVATSRAALGNLAAIADTARGFADVIGWDRVGIYADAFVIEWLYANTPVRHFLECEAWSGSSVTPYACLYQHARQQLVGGALCDVESVMSQPIPWRLEPRPYPAPRPVIRGNVPELQRSIRVPVDGLWGPVTDRAAELVRHRGPVIRALQTQLGCPVDGIWGPLTAYSWLAAVRGVQHALGVAVDGIWGPVTDAAYVFDSPYR
jgi:hypothetical protein